MLHILPVVLKAKVGEPGTCGSTFLDSHGIVVVCLALKRTSIGGLGIAALGFERSGSRRRRRRRKLGSRRRPRYFLVYVESITGSTRFGGITGASKAAVSFGSNYTAGAEGISTVALAAIFNAKAITFYTSCCAFFYDHLIVKVGAPCQCPRIRAFSIASLVGVGRGRRSAMHMQ